MVKTFIVQELFLLSPSQMAVISPFFPKPRGVAQVDDRLVVSGIIYVLKNGLRWCDAPREYGPYKTLYNRFRRWTVLAFSNGFGLRPFVFYWVEVRRIWWKEL